LESALSRRYCLKGFVATNQAKSSRKFQKKPTYGACANASGKTLIMILANNVHFIAADNVDWSGFAVSVS